MQMQEVGLETNEGGFSLKNFEDCFNDLKTTTIASLHNSPKLPPYFQSKLTPQKVID